MALLTGDVTIDALLVGDSYRWNAGSAPGTPVQLTYSFLTSVPSYYPADAQERVNFQPLSTTAQDVVRQALAEYARLCNVTLTEVAGAGDLTFGACTLPSTEAAHAYYPGIGTALGGDVWFGAPDLTTANIELALHEIGHALGLKHPFDVTAENGTTLLTADNEVGHTVMAYNASPYDLMQPVTPMVYDAAALQYLYGANETTFAGNSIYVFPISGAHETIWDGGGVDTIDASNQSAGSVIDLRAGQFSSIGPAGASGARDNIGIAWGAIIENAVGGAGDDVFVANDAANRLDGGAGRNTVSYEGAASGVTLNLATGETGGGAVGDTLLRIQSLEGSAFSDTLRGDAGDNTIEGGAGADTLDGSSGSDTLSYAGSAGAVSVNLATGAASGGDAQGDVIAGFENLIGSSGNDSLVGTAGNNILTGGAGADTLDGGGGSDTVSYAASKGAIDVNLSTGAGHGGDAEGDMLIGIENVVASSGNDMVTAGASADLIDGGAGIDTVSYAGSAAAVSVNLATGSASGGDAAGDALSNVENLIGSSLADRLTGDAGANVLEGGIGADMLDGGAGIDTASYAAAGSGVAANLASGGSAGAALGDVFAGIENLRGSAFNDVLVGDSGDNFIQGGAGDDLEQGGAGNDILVSGNGGPDFISALFQSARDGNDTLEGGAGNDSLYGGAHTTYLIHKGDGTDTVVPIGGSIVLDGLGFTDVAQVMSRMNSQIGNASIDLGGGQTLTISAGFHPPPIPHMPTLPIVLQNAAADGVQAWHGGAVTNVIADGQAQGTAGNDFLNGHYGSTATFRGGLGDDFYGVGDARIQIAENSGEGIDTVNAWVTYTLPPNVENIQVGAGYGVAVSGNALGNYVIGNAGDDTLSGAAGDDILSGNGGNDVMSGGAGHDVFVVVAGEGSDIITDFVAGTGSGDAVRLVGTGFASTAAVIGALTQAGADTVLALGGGQTLTFKSVARTSFFQNDFVLGGDPLRPLAEPTASPSAAATPTPTSTPAPAPAPTTTGQHTLVVRLAEDAWQGDAQFTVALDGVRLGDPSTVTASHAAGQWQDFVYSGNWSADTHQLTVSFLNDAWGGTASTDRNLYVGGLVFDGEAHPEDTAVLLSNGTVSFSMTSGATPSPAPAPTPVPTPAPIPTPAPTGQHTLVLHLAEDAWQGDAQFTVALDGLQLGAPAAVTASHAAGEWQDFAFAGDWGTGSHQITVTFLNDAWGGTASTDRNLYVGGLSLDGETHPEATASLLSNGSATFTVSGSAAPTPAPTPVPTPAPTPTPTSGEGPTPTPSEARAYVAPDGSGTAHGGAGAEDVFATGDNQTLIGGGGNDVFHIGTHSGISIQESNPGISTVATWLGSYTLPDTVDNLTGEGDVAHRLTGNAANNVITGAGGNDVLAGHGGKDILIGGAGRDMFVFDNAAYGADQASYANGAVTGGSHVADFTVGSDTLDLRGYLQAAGYQGADPLADGTIRLAAAGDGSDVSWNQGWTSAGGGQGLTTYHIVTIDHVAPSALHGSDFLFH